MNVLVDVGVATAVAVVFYGGLYRYRRSGGLLTTAMVIWAFSLGLTITAAARASTTFPTIAHLIWIVALVLACLGLSKVRETRANYVGPMLAMDTVMLGSTWLLVVWRVVLYQPGVLSDVHDWLLVPVLGFLANGVAVCILLVSNYPTSKLILMAFASLMLTASEVLAAHDHLRAHYSSDYVVSDQPWRLILSGGGVAVCLAATLCRRGFFDREIELEREERRRGLVVMPLIGLPVSILVWWRPDVPLDPASWLLGAIALACFLGREYVRNVHNTQLVARLGELAMRDPLTDIGNRRALAEDLANAFRGHHAVCLLSLDIDRFKEINRQLGHAGGDRVLVRFAELLRDSRLGRPYRLGGDEFALVVEGPLPEAFSGAESLRIVSQTAFAEMPDIEALAITISIGLAEVQDSAIADDPLELLTRSNQALRVAKADRNRVRVYSDKDAAAQEYRDSIHQGLRQALAERRVAFHYEPIVSMHEGVVKSVESLARWRDPVLGVVSPQEFVAVAEESGLIHELGRQSLEAGVATADWLISLGSPVSVSVNVSPMQLRRQSFADEVSALLDAHRVPPSRLTIEVTEGIFIGYDDPALDMLDRIGALGVNIAIDDFGSGYSSIGYITRLPTSTIKIDRSLTKEVGRPRSRSIISALLGVAVAHDLKVVCEGVETIEVATQLRDLGADLIQGWLYSPAVPEDQLLHVIETINAAHRPVPPAQRTASPETA